MGDPHGSYAGPPGVGCDNHRTAATIAARLPFVGQPLPTPSPPGEKEGADHHQPPSSIKNNALASIYCRRSSLRREDADHNAPAIIISCQRRPSITILPSSTTL
ncbi:hypothetical protein Dimus_001466, partial [Dionaea muscipula]